MHANRIKWNSTEIKRKLHFVLFNSNNSPPPKTHTHKHVTMRSEKDVETVIKRFDEEGNRSGAVTAMVCHFKILHQCEMKFGSPKKKRELISSVYFFFIWQRLFRSAQIDLHIVSNFVVTHTQQEYCVLCMCIVRMRYVSHVVLKIHWKSIARHFARHEKCFERSSRIHRIPRLYACQTEFYTIYVRVCTSTCTNHICMCVQIMYAFIWMKQRPKDSSK